MGLPGSIIDTQDSFIAVEFDTHFGPFDINGNYVGCDVNMPITVASENLLSTGIDLKRRREKTAWIRYSDSSKRMFVCVASSGFRSPSPILLAVIDLSKQLNEFMFVSFSASNEQGSALYLIHQWRFKTSGFSASTINKHKVEEEDDCLFCYPDDNTSNFHENTAEIIFCLGGLAIFSVIAILCFVTCSIARKDVQTEEAMATKLVKFK